uniref:Uncharacterized protein n=1 Tax=Glossina pallidipes TaxID=7398 RepID=A0A1B0ABN4_GLOPL
MCPIPLRPLTPFPEAEVEEVPLEIGEAGEEVVVIDNLPNWLPENLGQEQGQGHYDTEPVHRLRGSRKKTGIEPKMIYNIVSEMGP